MDISSWIINNLESDSLLSETQLIMYVFPICY